MAKKGRRGQGKSSIINVNRQANDFRFGGTTNVGTADAEQDRLLSDTFYDNGALELVLQVDSPESIIVGRTGAGKTALIERLNDIKPRVININPEELALGYLVDSTLLRFFYDSGIKMDMFYKLLWNHIFIVEILKVRYDINNEVSRAGILDRFKDLWTRNRGRSEAVNYLLDWGDKFWLGTEARVREVVNKLENQVQESVSADAKKAIPGLIDLSAKADKKNDTKVGEEIKAEIITRGREVVSRIQTQRIQELIRLLQDEVLSDRQKQFFITIDKLDENWVNDELRYQLLKSLIEVSRDLNNRVDNLKIVIALRQDLIARVFEKTQDSGFQEEKFKSLYIDLFWSSRELENLLELRVNKVISNRPTARSITMRDVLPQLVGGKKPLEYLINRTMLRPRDLIIFFNNCARAAAGKSVIGAQDIFQAEIEYSQSRFEALGYEWGTDYPNITNLIELLRKYPASFTISDVADKFRESALDFVTRNPKHDYIYSLINDRYTDNDPRIVVELCFDILYKIGVLGIKPSGQSNIYWSFKRPSYVSPSAKAKAIYYIHPCLWSALSIIPIEAKVGVY
ncbi:P-loop ATPase, Sll1717 family [Deinococcus aestuarii]|uniref:P-loop ATPase, Sll1717 family n=1 Tax=Deinococcus aestuarii TaxID=2774531 RepID=UPI001C0ABE51|nr:hypothetical protein [Deinococcus aestuarii]